MLVQATLNKDLLGPGSSMAQAQDDLRAMGVGGGNYVREQYLDSRMIAWGAGR